MRRYRGKAAGQQPQVVIGLQAQRTQRYLERAALFDVNRVQSQFTACRQYWGAGVVAGQGDQAAVGAADIDAVMAQSAGIDLIGLQTELARGVERAGQLAGSTAQLHAAQLHISTAGQDRLTKTAQTQVADQLHGLLRRHFQAPVTRYCIGTVLKCDIAVPQSHIRRCQSNYALTPQGRCIENEANPKIEVHAVCQNDFSRGKHRVVEEHIAGAQPQHGETTLFHCIGIEQGTTIVSIGY